ncbi:MAG: HAD-IB family hydrolase [Lachnospiraceae bacterium]|nr:HAD-IB family hydrolase [Lachnospiraceae bacterium]
MKVAVFDFCETLVSFQTADAFVKFIIEKSENSTYQEKYNRYKFLKKIQFYRLINLPYKMKGGFPSKTNLLKIISGMNKEDINNYAYKYYQEMIKPAIICDTLEVMENFKRNGFTVVLISAGYAPYIKLFAEEYDILYLTNEFSYKGSIFSGRTVGNDCYGAEKVARLKTMLGKENIEYLVTVSDSLSDKPLFDIAEEKIYVTKSKNIKMKGMKLLCWEK